MSYNTKLLYTDVEFYEKENGGNTEILVADTSGNIKRSGTFLQDKQDLIRSAIGTLTAAGWIGLTQTIAMAGVTSVSVVLVSSDQSEYAAYGVQGTAQGADSLTFTCTSVPPMNLTVKAVIIP